MVKVSKLARATSSVKVGAACFLVDFVFAGFFADAAVVCSAAETKVTEDKKKSESIDKRTRPQRRCWTIARIFFSSHLQETFQSTVVPIPVPEKRKVGKRGILQHKCSCIEHLWPHTVLDFSLLMKAQREDHCSCRNAASPGRSPASRNSREAP